MSSQRDVSRVRCSRIHSQPLIVCYRVKCVQRLRFLEVSRITMPPTADEVLQVQGKRVPCVCFGDDRPRHDSSFLIRCNKRTIRRNPCRRTSIQRCAYSALADIVRLMVDPRPASTRIRKGYDYLHVSRMDVVLWNRWYWGWDTLISVV